MKKILTTMVLGSVVISSMAQPHWEKINGINDTIFVSSPQFTFNDDYTFVSHDLYAAHRGIYRSGDNGDSWEKLPPLGDRIRTILANENGTLLAVAGSSSTKDKIYRSTDNGNTFIQATINQSSPGVPAPINYQFNNHALGYHNGNWYIVGEKYGFHWDLLKSTDDGQTWARVGGGYHPTGAYRNLTFIEDTLVSQFAYTTDEGSTWHNIPDAEPGSQGGAARNYIGTKGGYHYFQAPQHIYKTQSLSNPNWESVIGGITTNPNGGIYNYGWIMDAFFAENKDIFVSGQSPAKAKICMDGIDWTSIEDGHQGNTAIYGETTDGSILASGDGLYRYIGPRGSGTVGISSIKHPDFDVQIYPNPANDFITIANLPNGSTIKVADINGKLVYSTVISNEQLQLNTTQFANGIYIIQMKNNGNVTNRKLIVNRQ